MPSYSMTTCCDGGCSPFPGWDNIYHTPDYIDGGLLTPSGDNEAMRMFTAYSEECTLSEGLITGVNVLPNKDYMLIYTRTGYGYPFLTGGSSNPFFASSFCSDCYFSYQDALTSSIDRLYIRLTNAVEIPWDLDVDIMCSPELSPPDDFVTITTTGLSSSPTAYSEANIDADIASGLPWYKNSLCFSTGASDNWDRLYFYPLVYSQAGWFIIDEIRLYEDDFPTIPATYYTCPGETITIGSSFCADEATDIEFQWEIFVSGSWQIIPGETQPQLTVTPINSSELYRLTRTLLPNPDAPILNNCIDAQVEITVNMVDIEEPVSSYQALACCLNNVDFLLDQSSSGLSQVYDNMAYIVQNSGQWSTATNELVNVFGTPSGGFININADIIIPRGIDLTLNSMQMYFGSQERIIVEPGASLTIGSGTILDAINCHVVSQGIRVIGPGWGNQRAILSDGLPNYGVLHLLTGSTNSRLEDAIIGIAGMFVPLFDVNNMASQIVAQQNVLCANPSDLLCQTLTPLVLQPATNSTAAQTTAGGVIQSQGGVISNCFQGINLSWYVNTAPLGTIASIIEGTSFYCSSSGLLYPFNVLPGIAPLQAEAGIYGETYSRLLIRNGNTLGTFLDGNLKYGIRGFSINSWTIENNQFQNCTVGLSLAGNTFSTANTYHVTRNVFTTCTFAIQVFGGRLNTNANTIQGLPGTLTPSFGITAVRSQLNIYNDQISNTYAAFVLLNNSWATNIVQECAVQNNRIGTWLIGNNDGLFLYCNQFINNTVPWLLQDDTAGAIAGMLDDQGNCDPSFPTPADNVFVNSVFPDITSFIADGFVYYHHPVPQLTPTIVDWGGATTTASPCPSGNTVSCSTWQEIPDGMVAGLDNEKFIDYVLLKKFWNYLLDEQDTVAAVGLLNSLETNLAIQLKIAIAMEQYNFAEVQTLKNTLPDTDEETLHYKQLLQLEITLHQSERTYTQLTPEEEILVRQIATTNTLTAMDARIILYTAYGEEIMFTLPQVPALVAEETGNWNIHFKTNATDLSGKVRVYPNPAKEKINIQIHLSEAVPTYLQIYDAKGTLIQQTVLSDSITTLTFNIAQWASGLYYYRIVSDKNTPLVGRFVVIDNH
ncbi:T9SS C-terminal target domain-containing protein [Sphingobacteriales bacterium UPWRP_1]|nr:hypothetical protein BVG80_08950 [Sphingobacteriales bacterium TSM_CSM]PSJ76169.1 T9SS C-terminal target domain-containing protein [Sphingobacteriales bacterium UPWRP_1]